MRTPSLTAPSAASSKITATAKSTSTRYVPTWSGQPWVVLENLRLMAMQPARHDPAERESELRARQSAAEREFLAAVPDDLRNFADELVRLARAYTSLDDLEHYQTTRLNPVARAALIDAGGAGSCKRGALRSTPMTSSSCAGKRWSV